MIIYISCSSGRHSFYLSPITDFCLRPGNPQEPAARLPPPIWSVLLYVLLTETLNVSDETDAEIQPSCLFGGHIVKSGGTVRR